MKKTLSMLLAFSMLLGLLTTMAFAADADLDGHIYKAFQIFTGTQAENSAELGNVQWGDGIKGADLLAALKAEGSAVKDDFANCTTAADVAKVLSAWEDNAEKVKAFAKIADRYVDGVGIVCENGITTLPAGYYLVKDVTDFKENEENTVYNLALLQLTKDGTFEIANKTSVPTVEKKVKDTNDTTGETTGWQDSADYDIGDSVPFQLKATLADNVSAYDTYKVVFHDTLSDGLDFTEITTVTIDGKPVPAKVGNTAGYEFVEDEGTLTITIEDVKTFGGDDNSVVIVEYNATLDTDAVIGAAGNPNEVYLEYSNNPNAGGAGMTGKTPEDKVIVFTYKVVVNKVDSEKHPLEGAGFTLYKKNAAGNYVAIGEELKGDTLTTFTWTGLDDGDYKLSETTTPAGYNTIPDQEFTVTADHEILADNPTLTSLSGKATTGEVTFTPALSDGSLTAEVVNQTGSILPETGGIGTTIFYVLGGLMAVGAGVLLVAKKRMDA